MKTMNDESVNDDRIINKVDPEDMKVLMTDSKTADKIYRFLLRESKYRDKEKEKYKTDRLRKVQQEKESCKNQPIATRSIKKTQYPLLDVTEKWKTAYVK